MIPKNRCFSGEFLFVYSWHFVLQIIQIMRLFLEISRADFSDLWFENIGCFKGEFFYLSIRWHSLADFADLADLWFGKIGCFSGEFFSIFKEACRQNCKNEKSTLLMGNFSICCFRVRDRNGKPGMRHAAPQAQRGKWGLVMKSPTRAAGNLCALKLSAGEGYAQKFC